MNQSYHTHSLQPSSTLLAPVSVGGAPPLKEPTQHPPAMYNIFVFGINAPSEGDHSFSKNMFDLLARHPRGTLYPLPVIALGSQLIVMPWLQASHTAEASTIDHVALSYSPFDSLFSKTSRRDESASLVLRLQFIRRVFASSVPDAALFVDRGLSTNSGSTIYSHIFLPFFGGPDSHLALSFVVQLCMYGAISATVMCIR